MNAALPEHLGRPRLLLGVLLLVALIEVLVLMWRRPERVDWRESLATLGVALGHGLLGVLGRGVLGSFLLAVWSHRLVTVPIGSVGGLLALFLVSEFFYYWQHRLSHTMRWFWASHAVHHSPEHLNLSAAYRLGWTGTLSGLPLVFVPMILLGFAPLAIALMLAVNLAYQFFLHNEWVPRLGPLEWIFNTPSAHRVHHAKNAQYLDRNFGGILTVFDRLFGTYAAEEEACVYGLVHGIGSYNPLRIALFEWQAMWLDLRREKSLRGKLMALFGPPRALL
jgi:sterol desaturase/sphingolipid hydroxylase (fatty acid hydroxylase superfamily)